MITIIKREVETSGGNRYVYGIDCGNDLTGTHLISKPIKLYTLNIYRFLYVNHNQMA